MRKGFSIHSIIWLPLLVVLLACGKNQEKVVVNFDELRPKPERSYESDPDTITIPAFKPKDVSIAFRPIFEQIFIENQFLPSDSEIFPTRFGPEEFVAMTQQDANDIELASWYFLRFRDSVMTDNAWLNWLDCFGANCQSLSWGSGDNITERSGQIWTNDSLIIACISKKEGNMLVKETVKLDQFFEDNSRFSVRWSQNKPGAWKGSKVRKL
jgi:hypothetical protein